MSPIFVRPVREQLEHDRLIRFLQAKYKRKAEVALNVGDEQVAPVKLGTATFFPDLVLTDGKKLAGLVEVESGESVNNLEAMAQWVHFARSRVPFHLYVPVQSFEVARRLCDAYGAKVSELWTYRPTHEGFDLVRMIQDPGAARLAGGGGAAAEPAAARKPAPKKPAPKAAPAGAKKEAVRPVKKPEKPPVRKPAKAAKPARATPKAAGRSPGKARPTAKAAKARKPVRRK